MLGSDLHLNIVGYIRGSMDCRSRMGRAIQVTILGIAVLFLLPSVRAQELSKRLILKDGSYQLATKWEVTGDRVRYYSAEREEWEEVPNSLVDWNATNKWAKDRETGVPTPEAAAVDKELEAERQADEARNPQVAPGLRLPEDGGVVLLDNYQGQPQLIALQQSNGAVNKNTKSNILRATINPIASAKQTIEVAGPHAKIQAHATLPTIYVNVEQMDQLDQGDHLRPDDQPQKAQQAHEPWDRFRIVRMQAKGDKRVAGDIKVAVYGKVSQDAKVVPTRSEQLTGGWVKVTPTAPLSEGEYAVVEMLGKEGMNLSVWDFGLNAAAAANPGAWKPAPAKEKQPDKPKELEKRQ